MAFSLFPISAVHSLKPGASSSPAHGWQPACPSIRRGPARRRPSSSGLSAARYRRRRRRATSSRRDGWLRMKTPLPQSRSRPASVRPTSCATRSRLPGRVHSTSSTCLPAGGRWQSGSSVSRPTTEPTCSNAPRARLKRSLAWVHCGSRAPPTCCARSSDRLPELAAANQEVKDRANAPENADNRPEHLLASGEIVAPDDVDQRQDKGEWVEEDRNQDFEKNLH